jgi:hypothetical protein
VNQQLKKNDRAIEAYRKALEVEPGMPASMLPLAAAYTARGIATPLSNGWLARKRRINST